MMKASSITSGKTIICPQCLKKIVVPDKPDPKAEQLYLHIKKNGIDKIKGNRQKSAKPQTQTSIGAIERDEVDKWIDDFWTTLPDADSHAKPSTLHDNKKQTDTPNTKNNTQQNPASNPVSNKESKEKQLILRNDKTLRVVIISVVLTFIICFPAGFATREFLDVGNSGRGLFSNAPDDNSDKSEIRIEGKLSYKNEFGIKLPDADATILFLPSNAQTPVPISPDGLRVDDGAFEPNKDNVQRIMELGGIVQRTGANGGFNFSLKSGGTYNMIMISSHLKRTDATQLPPEVVNYLKKFFRNPIELVKDYRVEKEEYNINNGTQIIHKTFE
ncbi:MAG: hypothetical protein LBK06_01080 [Planctomycetaceae bacterium]|jgi:hypothetical protein|nr:hypothetical protein [Planctomycetaceae bacterium]